MKTILRKSITQEVEISLSGSDIADLFWGLDKTGQADFFNCLGRRSRLVFQLQAVTDSLTLDCEGRTAMARIGEYSSPF